MKLARRVVAYAAATTLLTGLATLVAPGAALAHGAMMMPGSRTYLCWQDGLTATGQVQPKNPACAAAVAQSGATALYNWFAVLRSDGGGRMAGYIPDGQLCSGGTGGPYDFTGFNLPRDDWPVTHLTSGANIEIDYNDWAKHPGTFSLYVTKDTWSPTRPLAWSDLEATPFSQVTNPTALGGPGTADGHYYWNAPLPSGKSGRHLIYSVWARSDSQETFYGCSDVVFDGGHGQVTGLGGGGTTPPVSPPATTPPVTSPPATTPPVTTSPTIVPPPVTSSPATSPAQGAGCSATYQVASSWPNGFQVNVTVANAGSTTTRAWSVNWTFASGQDVSQLWSGSLTRTGSGGMTVQNVAWNGTLAPGGSTTFGFIGSGSGAPPVPAVTCQAS